MDEPTPAEVSWWWRVYALALGAAARQDAVKPLNLDRLFRVADIVCGEPPTDTETHH